ncbi:MAG: PadR family transcriptional regulator [Gemmatimonadota bacterium]|nr:PadR family transcriptional regulator [Gemmatimonadota bacterium]
MADEGPQPLLRGTLDVMILKALSWGPMHGYGVTRWLRSQSDGLVDVDDAALYQALHRMRRRGWLESEWGRTDENRRAKYYNLTRRGRAALERERASLERYATTLLSVLSAEPAAGGSG